MLLIKLIATPALLAVTAFCVFGFLATFEGPGFLGWRIGYAVVGLSCLATTAWLLVRLRAKSAGTSDGHR